MPNPAVPANAIPLSAIFRAAHSAARRHIAPQSYPGAGRQWDDAKRAFVVTFTYRQAFATALRNAWADAKADARHAVLEASRPKLNSEEQASMADLEARAWAQDFTTTGVRNAQRIRAEMSAIRAAAAARHANLSMAA